MSSWQTYHRITYGMRNRIAMEKRAKAKPGKARCKAVKKKWKAKARSELPAKIPTSVPKDRSLPVSATSFSSRYFLLACQNHSESQKSECGKSAKPFFFASSQHNKALAFGIWQRRVVLVPTCVPKRKHACSTLHNFPFPFVQTDLGAFSCAAIVSTACKQACSSTNDKLSLFGSFDFLTW